MKRTNQMPRLLTRGFGIIAGAIEESMLFRGYKLYILDSIMIVRGGGFKELIRQRGRKFLLIIFSYFLIRDAIIYVLIPYIAAKGVL